MSYLVFLISIGLIYLNEKAKVSKKTYKIVLTVLFSIFIGPVLGLITMVDFYHAGILTVLVFYYFRGRKWYHYVAQFIALYYINIEILAGYTYEIVLFDHIFHLTRQGLALFALIPIWLYQGKQGYHQKWFKYFCYWFYPVHLLVLGLIKLMS